MTVNRRYVWVGLLVAVLLVFLWRWGAPEKNPNVRKSTADPTVAHEAARIESHAHGRIRKEECAACPDLPSIQGEKRPTPPDNRGECLEILAAAAAAGDPNPDTSHLGNCFNVTPLHIVESLDDLRTLLSNGADPNARDHLGRTPLHKVVFSFHGTPEMVDALLAAGADPDLEDDQGRTAHMTLAIRPNLRRDKYVADLTVDEIAAEIEGVTLEEYYARRPHRKAFLGEYSTPDDSHIVRMQVSLRKASAVGRRVKERLERSLQ